MRQSILKCQLPVAAGAGSFIITDPRGVSPYALVMTDDAAVYWLDINNEALMALDPAPATPHAMTWGAGACAAWDVDAGTAGYVWVFAPAAAPNDAWFHFIDLSAMTWDYNHGGVRPDTATLAALLGAAWGTDGDAVCLSQNVNANGNGNLYLSGNGAVATYQFTGYNPGVAGGTWTAFANRTAAANAGTFLSWPHSFDHNSILSVDAGASPVTWENLVWGTPAWGAWVPVPGETTAYGAGTCACTSFDGRKIYLKVSATNQILEVDASSLTITPKATLYGDPEGGSASVGKKLCCYNDNGTTALLALKHGSNLIQRIEL